MTDLYTFPGSSSGELQRAQAALATVPSVALAMALETARPLIGTEAEAGFAAKLYAELRELSADATAASVAELVSAFMVVARVPGV